VNTANACGSKAADIDDGLAGPGTAAAGTARAGHSAISEARNIEASRRQQPPDIDDPTTADLRNSGVPQGRDAWIMSDSH
jgi:hypothetical protein